MAKDWITGRSWNTGGGGGSPFAMAAIGLLQALQNNRREDERKEEYERMMQEKKAMQEIQTGRTLMERIAQMDPALWGDQGFVDAWKAGDTTYPAKIGWKPQQTPKSFNDQNVGGSIVRLDPETGEYKTVYAKPDDPTSPKAPPTAIFGGKVHAWNGTEWVPLGASEGQLNRDKPNRGPTPVDPNKITSWDEFVDADNVKWRVAYNANGEEVKRVKVGSVRPTSGVVETVDITQKYGNPPPAPPKKKGVIASLFGTDDDEDDELLREVRNIASQ